MEYSYLLNASLAIKIHLLTAVVAFLIGLIQLLSRKGTVRHKWLGYLWVVLMLTICLASFGIKEIMPMSVVFGYSPIHLLSIWVLFQVFRGLYFARIGNIIKHKRCMLSTYFGGLIIAGVFTLMPGRLLYKTFVATILN